MTTLFPDRDAPGRLDVGDPLERCYTPQPLADAIVDAIADTYGPPGPAGVIEPSIGGGSFARAVRRRWPDTHLFGIDADPTAPGLRPDLVAFVLPLAFLGVDRWRPWVDRLSMVRPITGRPWPRLVREVAVFEWTPGGWTTARMRPLPDWRRS